MTCDVRVSLVIGDALRGKLTEPVKDAAERVTVAVDRVADNVTVLVAIAVLALMVASAALIVSGRVLREVRSGVDP